jgi:3-hydroxymyristoyl/3-hydroxydecanoyl-(acyl carrier protein) dehydratase
VLTQALTDPHFAAYSFVDRIVDFEPGRRARGRFLIPQRIDAFPSALVAEAIGQLAAWCAMDAIDFRGRPVAGLATETRFFGDAKPGDTLELVADLHECNDEAVAYDGHASVGGQRIVELVDCLGPMLPVAEFDDPGALRARLALLRSAGAEPGRFSGVHDIAVDVTERARGRELRARVDVPEAAPFFGDHFPRRPVFPATLLLDTQIRLALDLAREAAGNDSPRPSRVTHVKMRSFIVPSQKLDIAVKLGTAEGGIAKAMMSAATDERTVASARLEIAMEAAP